MGIVDSKGRPDNRTARLIRKKARLLAGKHGFPTSDQEEIEQELWLHLLKRFDCFDPSKGKETSFIAHLIDNRIRTMIEHQRAGKRSCEVPVDSLDAPVDQDSDGERHEVVDREFYLRATGQINRPLAELQDLALDVAEAIRSLPFDLREIAHLLMKHTVTETSEIMNIARTTVNDRRRQIRRVFEERGICDYLEKTPSFRRRFR